MICDCPHLFNARFQHGFDAVYQHRDQEGDKPLLRLNDPTETIVPLDTTHVRPMFRDHPLVDVHRWTNRNPRYEGECFPAQKASTAIRWLQENDGVQPFFLWIDFFDVVVPQQPKPAD